MTADKVGKAIVFYLGYNPGIKVELETAGARGDAFIKFWDKSIVKSEPTIEQLQIIYNNNIDDYNLEQAKKEKKIEIKEKIKEKLAEADQEYITKNSLIDAAESIEDLEGIS